MAAPTLQEIAAAGHRAIQEGRLRDGIALLERALAGAPDDLQTLYALGVVTLQTNQSARSVDYLSRAARIAPRDPLVRMSLAVAFREAGDADQELAALIEALDIDPYFLPALLAKGACHERRGEQRAAETIYRNVLKIAPDERRWPAELRDHLLHASRIRDQSVAALHRHLTERAGAATEGGLSSRMTEALAIMAGAARPYVQEPTTLLAPRLPAIPFYETRDFPFLAELERKTDEIRMELEAALGSQEGFAPYVAYPAGAPVNQWAELNHSSRWGSLFLWKDGAEIPENHRRFPRTVAALKALPMADIEGFCPTAMFSALAPHTHIPPHTGETNARLVVHLPLVVPPNCSYRVGAEHRSWDVGRCLVFDDSIEHEARNDSDELRVVLIFDLWNPFLDAGERAVMRAALSAAKEYHAQSAPLAPVSQTR